jgi:hypothetical protein
MQNGVPSHREEKSTKSQEREENLETHESRPRKHPGPEFIENSSFGPIDSSFIFATEERESKISIHDILSSVGNIEQRIGVHDCVLLLRRQACACAEI